MTVWVAVLTTNFSCTQLYSTQCTALQLSESLLCYLFVFAFEYQVTSTKVLYALEIRENV